MLLTNIVPGVTTEKILSEAAASSIPDYVLQSLGDLTSLGR